MNLFRHKRHRPGQRGQGLVEFALAFPVFLLIILGVFEFGRLFITYTSIYAAAREGARFGAAVENVVNSCAGVEAQAQRAGFIAGNLNVLIQHDTGPGSPVASGCGTTLGERIIVTASIPYESVTGIIPDLTLSSVARRTIIREVHLVWTLPPPDAPTATPKPASTAAAPTATSAPGASPTPPPTSTPTTAGVCNGTITWTAGTNGASTATFTNNSGEQYTLTSIIVTWAKKDPLLNEVIYVGGIYDPISGLLLTSPATVAIPDWVVGTGTTQFEFVFSENNAKFTGVSLVMEDGNGVPCQVW